MRDGQNLACHPSSAGHWQYVCITDLTNTVCLLCYVHHRNLVISHRDVSDVNVSTDVFV